MRNGRNRTANAGFTLVEIMVAAGLSLFIIAIMISASVTYQKLFKTQNLTNEMQQNVRAAIEMVSRDLRTCGYGLRVSSGNLSEWIDWIAGFDTNPKILAGSSGSSDTLYVAAAFEAPVGVLIQDAFQGDTTIAMNADTDKVDTGTKRVIFIGGLQTARVTLKSGNIWSISTHPTGGAGLEFNIERGAPVEVVSVVTYQPVDNPAQYPYEPYLQRIDANATYAADWQKMAAGNIETFNAAVTGKVVDITITGRTAEQEYGYTHPTMGDGYRRFTVSTRVIKKN